MGLVKLAAVVFAAYAAGGYAGELVAVKVGASRPDSIEGARWAGRAVSFVIFGFIANKVL
jgi:hypothetical protein